MRRLLTTACVWLAAAGCAASALPTAHPPSPVSMPEATHLSWRGFEVDLEPTVVLWGRDAGLSLRDVLERTLTRVDAALSSPPVRIHVQGGSYRTIPDVGIGGFTDPSNGAVQITMDHRSPVGLRKMLTVWLPIALAHELHHSKRILDGPGYGSTLLESVITEGGAEAFVREIYPHAPSISWVRALSPKDEADVWHRAQADLAKPDDWVLHERWFFGGGDLPRWAGYKLGYALVSAFLARHPQVSAADLASMDAAEIFRQSGYDP